MPELSIVVPGYNEAKRLPATVEKIVAYMQTKKVDYELILVNNASKDDTLKVMESYAAKNPRIRVLSTPTKGKGLAVKTGISAANGTYVMFTDADLSTPIEELEKLWPFVKGEYAMAYGTRAMKESNIVIAQPLHRRLLGQALKLFLSVLIFTLPPRPTDTQCGFKMYKTAVAKELFQRVTLHGGMFDVEHIYIARQKKIPMKEVPVTWADDARDSKVNIWKSMVQNPAKLIGIRLKHLAGYYK